MIYPKMRTCKVCGNLFRGTCGQYCGGTCWARANRLRKKNPIKAKCSKCKNKAIAYYQTKPFCKFCFEEKKDETKPRN